jgi:hypothetical protein
VDLVPLRVQPVTAVENNVYTTNLIGNPHKNKAYTPTPSTKRQNRPHLHISAKEHEELLRLLKIEDRKSFAHKTKQNTYTNRYNSSGIYQMKGLDCPSKYT